MGSKAPLLAARRYQDVFRAPPPADQPICDVYAFPVGASTFVVVTTLCLDRSKPGTTRIYRMSSRPPFVFDPEPVLTLALFHPRNIALSPERGGRRWLWIADHGIDEAPFPGGASPLYGIHESGRVEVKDDPLLRQQEFSFDGCFWEGPGSEGLFLYQSNLGVSAPRLLYWKSMDGPAEDFSTRLPAGLVERRERFLVARCLEAGPEGVRLFLGGDHSDRSVPAPERDLVLRLPYAGDATPCPHPLPPRLKDATWSTVEAQVFELEPGGPRALLALYHDFGFTEGAAEILHLDGVHLRRPRAPLPLPTLAGKRIWIARAAIGDLDGDGRNDIVLYLRSTDGVFSRESNNFFLLRQCSSGEFDYATCQDAGYETHFPGGFFVGGELIQVRSDGTFQQTWFSF